MLSFLENSVEAKELLLNSVRIAQAPEWLKKTQLDEIVKKIERKLEWSIRRVDVTWYSTQEEFLGAFGKKAPTILAFTRKRDGGIHVGPKVSKDNFNAVFGHELGHVIFAQKFKKAIPQWIEEGIVNHIAGVNQINFAWLLKQERIPLRSLQHPFDSANQDATDFHYMATSAAVKMLESTCASFRELLNLSLRSNIDDYIQSYCKISDLDSTFWKWVEKQNAQIL